MEQLKRWGGQCVHVLCLPPILPADFKEQAGRTQGFHNHVRDPSVASHSQGFHNHVRDPSVAPVTKVFTIMCDICSSHSQGFHDHVCDPSVAPVSKVFTIMCATHLQLPSVTKQGVSHTMGLQRIFLQILTTYLRKACIYVF